MCIIVDNQGERVDLKSGVGERGRMVFFLINEVNDASRILTRTPSSANIKCPNPAFFPIRGNRSDGVYEVRGLVASSRTNHATFQTLRWDVGCNGIPLTPKTIRNW